MQTSKKSMTINISNQFTEIDPEMTQVRESVKQL